MILNDLRKLSKTSEFGRFSSGYVLPPSWSVNEILKPKREANHNHKLEAEKIKKLSKLASLSLSEARVEQLVRCGSSQLYLIN
jgi:hypothetical protein